MNYGPIVRIILRYLVGGAFMGSVVIGEKLAADPDLVAMGSLGIAAIIEAYYTWAKSRGKAT